MQKGLTTFVGTWGMEDNPCVYTVENSSKSGAVQTERGMTQIVLNDPTTDGIMEIVTDTETARELAEQILSSINAPDGA